MPGRGIQLARKKQILILAVDFMKRQNSGEMKNLPFTLVVGPMPVLVCEEGAKLRKLDMRVANIDAVRWWETGKVPLRPTPTA